MSLSITQQKIKGGYEVLMVRDRATRLMTFPLDMRALANQMCLEGNELDEEQYPALVRKYQEKRGKLEHKQARPTGHWTPHPEPVSDAAPQPAGVMDTEITTANAETTLGAWLQSPVPEAPAQPDDPLAALLTAAREAEIELAFRKGEFSKANADLAVADKAAYKAWEEFNKALRDALPASTHVQGIMINKGFLEALEAFVQGKGEEE